MLPVALAVGAVYACAIGALDAIALSAGEKFVGVLLAGPLAIESNISLVI